jgi:hypothetical protein
MDLIFVVNFYRQDCDWKVYKKYVIFQALTVSSPPVHTYRVVDFKGVHILKSNVSMSLLKLSVFRSLYIPIYIYRLFELQFEISNPEMIMFMKRQRSKHWKS